MITSVYHKASDRLGLIEARDIFESREISFFAALISLTNYCLDGGALVETTINYVTHLSCYTLIREFCLTTV